MILDVPDAAIGMLAFITIFAGGMAGLQLYRLLPEHHLTTETRDVVRLGIGMISILASLVLGLLTASAKSTFDDADRTMRSYTADIILLDGMLRNYGTEADTIRKMVLEYTERARRTTWGDQSGQGPLEDKNLGKLRRARSGLTIWPFDERAAAEFGRLRAELRRLGRPMQVIDIMIAASAFSVGNCTVVSADTDLAAVPGLTVENWS